jgi:hypothetical protein
VWRGARGGWPAPEVSGGAARLWRWQWHAPEACARGRRHGGARVCTRGVTGRFYSQPPFASKQEREGEGDPADIGTRAAWPADGTVGTGRGRAGARLM